MVIDLEMQPSIPYMLKGDMVKLRQILSNLLGNAIKFTSRGEINVSVKRLQDNNCIKLQFYVKDTGIGIKKEKQVLLFERFTQTTESNDISPEIESLKITNQTRKGAKKKILVVEDDEASRFFIQTILNKHDMEFVAACDGNRL